MGRLLIVLGLVAAACGGSATGSTIAPAGSVETTSAAETISTTTRVRPDGRDAPDFVLALGQGGEFSLSAEPRPVYMVFWAEW